MPKNYTKKQVRNSFKKKKILIFGKGQIGTMYFNYFLKSGYASFMSGADITKPRDLEREVGKIRPEVVINAAGKTNLEWCELNKLEAFNVNSLGPDNIAGICLNHDIYFIHLSSGCIFQSTSPRDKRKETDKPNPAAFYSWTKVWAENLITSRKGLKYLILRPRQPVSGEVNQKNMLIKMLTFSKFVGESGGWNSGTVLEDLMEITEKLINKKVQGVLNVANDGWTTPYRIALLLKKHINPGMKFEKITHDELDKITPNKRVATVLDISKLQSFGIRPQKYEKRLEEIILELKKNLKKKNSREILEKTVLTTKERSKTNMDWEKIFKED